MQNIDSASAELRGRSLTSDCSMNVENGRLSLDRDPTGERLRLRGRIGG